MSSLAELPELVGFFSYSRKDDEHSAGSLSRLRTRIHSELIMLLGRDDFRLWQDTAAIPLGALWEDEIRRAIAESVFFIPIVTPSAVRSVHCRLEFESFLKRETELGRSDLVFPILYIPVPALGKEQLWRQDPVLKIIGARQYFDWTKLRVRDVGSPEVAEKIVEFCTHIFEALDKPWQSPAERGRGEEAAARQSADEEKRKQAEIVARQRANEAGGDAGSVRRENVGPPKLHEGGGGEAKVLSEKKLSLSSTKSLSLAPRSFSTGRKSVVVEKVKSRIAASPVGNQVAASTPSQATSAKESGLVLRVLTEEEQKARIQALNDARLREAEARKIAEEQALIRKSREDAERAEREEAERRQLTIKREAEAREEAERRRLITRERGDGGEHGAEFFQDIADGPEMVVVLAGTFTMGAPESEQDRESWKKGTESPSHIVRIATPFAVGRCAVTRGQFTAFVKATGYKADGGHIWTGSKFKFDPKASWRNPGFPQTDGHPVVCVSWEDAKAYVSWLAEVTGKPYRLLSEAEWEFAARAGTTTRFWWGDSITSAQANYDATDGGISDEHGWGSKGEFRRSTVPVDSFEANAWGLFNVHGNVWELCEDVWHDDYNGAPSDGSSWSRGGEKSRVVVRGGSWADGPWLLRSASRNWVLATYRNFDQSFRVARTLML